MQIKTGIGLIQLGDSRLDGQRRPNGSLRVVLVGGRGAEQGHHRITDELLHRPPEALQLSPEPLVVGGQQPADVLNIQALGSTGEADQVAEQHTDPLALLPPRAGGGDQGRAADPAESEPGRVVLTATGADRHDSILRRWRWSGRCATDRRCPSGTASCRCYGHAEDTTGVDDRGSGVAATVTSSTGG